MGDVTITLRKQLCPLPPCYLCIFPTETTCFRNAWIGDVNQDPVMVRL